MRLSWSRGTIESGQKEQVRLQCPAAAHAALPPLAARCPPAVRLRPVWHTQSGMHLYHGTHPHVRIMFAATAIAETRADCATSSVPSASSASGDACQIHAVRRMHQMRVR